MSSRSVGMLSRERMHATRSTAETEGIEPPTLAGSCFQDSVLDQPDSLHKLSSKQRRPESNGLLLVQSEPCEPLHYAATNPYRCRRRISLFNCCHSRNA